LIFRPHPDMVRGAWVRGRRLEGPLRRLRFPLRQGRVRARAPWFRPVRNAGSGGSSVGAAGRVRGAAAVPTADAGDQLVLMAIRLDDVAERLGPPLHGRRVGERGRPLLSSWAREMPRDDAGTIHSARKRRSPQAEPAPDASWRRRGPHPAGARARES
jgi:hypothetical protein